MIKLVKLELLKLHKVLIVFSIFFIIFSASLILIFLHGYSYQYNIEVWSEAYTLILFLFPIFCTAPTTWLLYYEKKDHFMKYSVIRATPFKYLTSKLLVHCIYGFMITFLMSMVGLLLSKYAIDRVSGIPNPIHVFQLNYFLNHPLIYGLILSLWRSVLSILFVAFGFIVSLLFSSEIYSKKLSPTARAVNLP